MLYYAILYSTVQYSTILYYTILVTRYSLIPSAQTVLVPSAARNGAEEASAPAPCPLPFLSSIQRWEVCRPHAKRERRSEPGPHNS